MNAASTSATRLHGHWLLVARVAWVALVALSLGVLAASIPPGFQRFFSLAQDPSFNELGLSPNLVAAYLVTIQVVFALGCLVPAAVIFWRRSDNWMAMLVSLVGATFGTNIPVVYTLQAAYPEWHLPIALPVYFSQASGIIASYLFPDGRFVPRWIGALAAVLGGWMLASLLFPAAPFSPEVLSPPLLFVLVLGYGGTAVFAQTYRYIHVSSQAQRQQTKWVVFGMAVAIVGYIGDIMLPIVLPPLHQPGFLRAVYSLVIGPAFRLSMLIAPLAIGLSILRYRLWDIDFVVNRSLVYSTLTVVLGTLFVGSLFVVSQIFQALGRGQQSVIAIAMSALVCGALFQPSRRRLQRFVDQRFYGIQIDYQETVLPSAVTVASPRFGAYTGLDLIGCGGMAEVYKARHPTLNRTVAIKVLLRHLVQETDFCKRFEREAQTIASLRHPNIVQVFEYGETDGLYYMVMEYIAGPDLKSFLHERGRLPLAQALLLVQDIASALDHAHEQGLVHRDVKSSNVLLKPTAAAARQDMPYQAVLTDFGLVKIIGTSTHLTRTGILGTFSYIAPEQIKATADVDRRADVYALGIMVYEMLTGELPFRYQNPGALLIAHMTQPPPDACVLVSELPTEVASALQRALAKNPEERYATAGEFVRALG